MSKAVVQIKKLSDEIFNNVKQRRKYNAEIKNISRMFQKSKNDRENLKNLEKQLSSILMKVNLDEYYANILSFILLKIETAEFASKSFYLKNFENVEVTKIAKEISYERTTVYRYFKKNNARYKELLMISKYIISDIKEIDNSRIISLACKTRNEAKNFILTRLCPISRLEEIFKEINIFNKELEMEIELLSEIYFYINNKNIMRQITSRNFEYRKYLKLFDKLQKELSLLVKYNEEIISDENSIILFEKYLDYISHHSLSKKYQCTRAKLDKKIEMAFELAFDIAVNAKIIIIE